MAHTIANIDFKNMDLISAQYELELLETEIKSGYVEDYVGTRKIIKSLKNLIKKLKKRDRKHDELNRSI